MFTKIAILFIISMTLSKTTQSLSNEEYVPFGETYDLPDGPVECNRGYQMFLFKKSFRNALHRGISHKYLDYMTYLFILAHSVDMCEVDIDEGATLLSMNPLGNDRTTLKYLKIVEEKMSRVEIDYLRRILGRYVKVEPDD